MLAVLLALAVPTVVWMLLNRSSNVTSCIHCGECLRTGECTQVKKRRQRQMKNAAACLDKKNKKDIIISVKEQNRCDKDSFARPAKREGER
ncbi:hypothetical protein [Dysosmobacter sp.]|uniref:hypothetical protein n=1 Tax=Dysosmobacter sp. TaxID=2591382 RepID=UPI002D7FF60E|nr:hypothetical protein [Dysosmobacter sp.]